MSAVAKTLDVARSNLAERKQGATKPRGRDRKAEDARLLPLIRAIIDERPTYGSPRLRSGEPEIGRGRQAAHYHETGSPDHANHGLTLERPIARRPGRSHDGAILALL